MTAPEPPVVSAASAFGDRFQIRRRLGASGMGVVYAAYDRSLDRMVALKTAQRLDPLGLALFKNEFRALADIDHPNLVRLFELFRHEDLWFFTMELVDGPSLLAWLWDEPEQALDRTASPSELAIEATLDLRRRSVEPPGTGGRGLGGADGSGEHPVVFDTRPPPPPEVEGRLRSAMVQLVRGVAAMHARGLVHRDIKPDNVRVDADGRVVLLDFGLAVRPDGTAGEGHSGGFVVGTRGYMSPQQATGFPPTEADDWYAVGAVLYHALVGKPPRRGPLGETPPIDRRGRPADLVDLCEALLAPESAARPGVAEILARLGEDPEPDRPRIPLVGRRSVVAALDHARARCAAGRPSLTHLWGPSGVGKSFVVEAWLADKAWMGDADAALVLRGRSHRREDVPFGPFDSMVDDLARRLADWRSAAIDTVLPRHAGELATLFPVLERLPEFKAADAPRLADPRALRRRALDALREMLGRLAERRAVVIFLDDVQNGGPDSAALLEALLAQPDPPAVHVISCARRTQGSPLIDALRAAAEGEGLAWAECCVPVGPLPPDEAQALAARLLGAAADDALIERVTAEAGGHPFLITELSTAMRMRLDVTPGGLTLAEALRARVADLPGSARVALEVLALAGRPVPPKMVVAAAGLTEDGGRALATLRAASLARGGLAPGTPIEAFHDAIIAAVADGLAADTRRAHHRALAEQLEGVAPLDHEQLARHWEGAGDPPRAAGHALAGGRAAVEATAFERGAFFFREALRLGSDDPTVRRGLAEALQLAGRADEAAQAWLACAADAPPEARRIAERTAAAQWLLCGRVGRARALLAALMRHAGLRRPTRRLRMVLSVAWRTLRAFLLGRRGDPGAAARADALAAERFDLCMAEMAGWYAMSPLEIAWTLARASADGPRSGDPRRAAIGLACARVLVALSGLPGSPDAAARLAAAAARLAGDTPEARTPIDILDIAVAVRQGRWMEAVESARALDQTLAEMPALTGWEPLLNRAMYCFSTGLAGRYADLRARLPEMLADARQRGARVEEGLIALLAGVHAHLADGDPAAADRAVDDFFDRWDEVEASALSVLGIINRARIARYRGDAAGAVEILEGAWPRIGALAGGRFNFLRDFTHLEQGLSALFARRTLPRAEERVRESVAILRRGTWGAGRAWALALEAGLAAADGDRAEARRRLGASRGLFHHGTPPPRVEPMFDYFDGVWQTSTAGLPAVERAIATLTDQGVRDPQRWIDAVMPLPRGPAALDDRAPTG